MSDPGAPSGVDNRLQASHEQRAAFERFCFRVGPWSVVLLVAIVLLAIVWPPAAPGASDWGRAAIDKAKEAWPTLGVFYTYLTTAAGSSLLRGHWDARIGKGPSA